MHAIGTRGFAILGYGISSCTGEKAEPRLRGKIGCLQVLERRLACCARPCQSRREMPTGPQQWREQLKMALVRFCGWGRHRPVEARQGPAAAPPAPNHSGRRSPRAPLLTRRCGRPAPRTASAPPGRHGGIFVGSHNSDRTWRFDTLRDSNHENAMQLGWRPRVPSPPESRMGFT